MKKSIHILLLVLIPSCLFAQVDSILAENIFKYELKNGRATRNRKIIQQNTFDINHKLARQVYYDSVRNIAQSTLLFYDGELLISKETYGADFSIDSVRRIKYDNYGRRLREDLFIITEGIIKKKSWRTYTYLDNRLAKKVTYFGNKKWKIKTTYEKDDLTEIETNTFKKGADPSGIKEIIIKTSYESNMPAFATITSDYYNKTVSIKTIRFTYDTINYNMVSKKWFNSEDSLLKEVMYKYYPDGHIRSKSTRLASGDYTEHLVHERRNHTIVLGKPEMYAIPEED